MTVASVVKGRVTIEYDLGRPAGQRVQHAGITVGGLPLTAAFVAAVTGTPTTPPAPEKRVKALLIELYDGVWELDGAVPKDTLASRDAADKVHELVVSPTWGAHSKAGQNQAALDYCLWALRTCEEWEAAGGTTPRYIHKGTPFYFAAISALRLRNIDIGLMLLERGDWTDSETYSRAGLPEKGVSFPGRATLSLNPLPENLLHGDVVSMRGILGGWLQAFAAHGAQPSGDDLTLADLDQYFFGDEGLTTEARYLFGYLLWTNLTETDSVLLEARARGPLGRRRQAEWVLGLLTATEGMIRIVGTGSHGKENYSDVVADLIAREAGGGLGGLKTTKNTLHGISDGHKDDVEACLTYWAAWSPAGPTTGFPWWVRWIEAGRFVRNQTAHILEAPGALAPRWTELERTAKFALFSAIRLYRSVRRAAPPTGIPSAL